MKNNVRRWVVTVSGGWLTVAAFSGGLIGEDSVRLVIQPEIRCEPEHLLAMEWTPVTLSVRAAVRPTPEADLDGLVDFRYVWSRDGVRLRETTQWEYVIPHVLQPDDDSSEPHHVGTYRVEVIPYLRAPGGPVDARSGTEVPPLNEERERGVVPFTVIERAEEPTVVMAPPRSVPGGVEMTTVTNRNLKLQWPGTEKTEERTMRISFESVVSRPIHLSVYGLSRTNSNGGMLTAPVGSFYSGAGSVCCPTPPFDRFQVYYPFDGPGVSPPSVSFPNRGYTNLFVTTRLRANSTNLNTGIEVRQHFVPMGWVCENHQAYAGGPVHSSCDDGQPPHHIAGWLAQVDKAHGLERGKRYRVVIRYASNTLPQGASTISFRWEYTNVP